MEQKKPHKAAILLFEVAFLQKYPHFVLSLQQRLDAYRQILADLGDAERQGDAEPYPYTQLSPSFLRRAIDMLSLQLEAGLSETEALDGERLIEACKRADRPVQALKCMELVGDNNADAILECWRAILAETWRRCGCCDVNFITEVIQTIVLFRNDAFVPFSGILASILKQALHTSTATLDQVRDVVCLFATRCRRSKGFVATELRSLLLQSREESWRLLVSECIIRWGRRRRITRRLYHMGELSGEEIDLLQFVRGDLMSIVHRRNDAIRMEGEIDQLIVCPVC